MENKEQDVDWFYSVRGTTKMSKRSCMWTNMIAQVNALDWKQISSNQDIACPLVNQHLTNSGILEYATC